MTRVLIVDDDENNRAVAADALECEEYDVFEAVDGHDCLKQVKQNSFDLILLDVMMPGIDGIETLRLLKENEATCNIPVIMVTALNMDSQIAACLDEGAIDHVTKPYSSMILRARVRAAMRSKTAGFAKPVSSAFGQTLAIVGVKGGVGATTLAVNIGAKLVQAGESATVCETQPDAFSASVQLGLTPRSQFEHLLSSDVRISRSAIEQRLLNHPSGIRLLLEIASSSRQDEAPSEDVAELVNKLREISSYTILDVGACQSATGLEFLRQADQVLMVLELEPCSLVAAQRRLVQFAENDVNPRMLHAVINNRVPLPSPPFGPNYVKENLNCHIASVVPADPEGCLASTKRGAPICLLRPESTMAGALAALTNKLDVNRPAAMTS